MWSWFKRKKQPVLQMSALPVEVVPGKGPKHERNEARIKRLQEALANAKTRERRESLEKELNRRLAMRSE